MPDPRFYETGPAASIAELAALTGARAADESVLGRSIDAVASLAGATMHDVTFHANPRRAEELRGTRAGACFMTEASVPSAPNGCAVLLSPLPQAAFARAAERLVLPRRLRAPATMIDPSAIFAEDVFVAPGAIIGPRVEIGGGSSVGPGAFIGPGVLIGRDCHIGPRAVVGFALIGDRVRIDAGVVIGEPGFGAAAGPLGVVDLPQLGRVILQDGVTVGANSCIDRGAFDDTVVGENTKIDNLVQIAHNVVIGRNCLLAAFTGISGSTVIGDGCMFGGRAGVADHLTIGPGARIAAAAGVMKNVPAGESWGGSPARPVLQWLKETAWLARRATRRSGGEGL